MPSRADADRPRAASRPRPWPPSAAAPPRASTGSAAHRKRRRRSSTARSGCWSASSASSCSGSGSRPRARSTSRPAATCSLPARIVAGWIRSSSCTPCPWSRVAGSWGAARPPSPRAWREWLVHRIGGLLPVWRGGVGIDHHVASARAVLAAGAVFVQMPEGTVSGPPGRLGPMRSGWAIIALRTDATILPLAMAGTEELYLGRRMASRVLPPTTVRELAGLEPGAPLPAPGTREELDLAQGDDRRDWPRCSSPSSRRCTVARWTRPSTRAGCAGASPGCSCARAASIATADAPAHVAGTADGRSVRFEAPALPRIRRRPMRALTVRARAIGASADQPPAAIRRSNSMHATSSPKTIDLRPAILASFAAALFIAGIALGSVMNLGIPSTASGARRPGHQLQRRRRRPPPSSASRRTPATTPSRASAPSRASP